MRKTWRRAPDSSSTWAGGARTNSSAPFPARKHTKTKTHKHSADVLYDGPDGAWSPALTVSKLCLTLRSMLASNADKRRPPGDADYCRRVGTRSPKLTQWRFDDDSV